MTILGGVPHTSRGPRRANVGQYVSNHEPVSPQTDGVSTAHIAFVLDCSGSMSQVKDATISAFNAQVDTLRNVHGLDTRVSFITFNDVVYEHCFDQHPDRLEKLSPSSYRPDGWTALYDAVGYTIEKLCHSTDSHDLKSTYLVVILTDGDENYSKFFNSHIIRNKIQALQDTKRWTFSYIGCNQDLTAVQRETCIPVSCMATYTNTADGMHNMAKSISRGLETYCNAVADGGEGVLNFGSTSDGFVNLSDVPDTNVTNDVTNDDKNKANS